MVEKYGYLGWLIQKEFKNANHKSWLEAEKSLSEKEQFFMILFSPSYGIDSLRITNNNSQPNDNKLYLRRCKNISEYRVIKKKINGSLQELSMYINSNL